MAITTPRWYPAAWAADQQLTELSAEDVVTAFPSGLDQRPTRQTLNRALQYATNGVIYYLIHGVPEWSAAAQYPTGGIVRFGDQFYRAAAINANVSPGNAAFWELLPWRKGALNAIYLTLAFGDAHFLTLADADQRFYSKAQMDALFITQSDMALIYVTQAALRAEYITREQAESIFLTEALADVRYAITGETVTWQWLTHVLEDYLSSADGRATFLTPQGGDDLVLNLVQARATYLLQESAQFEAKEGAAISRYRDDMNYPFGVLVFDPESNQMYRSLMDNNIGNALSDDVFWELWSPPTAEPAPLTMDFIHGATYMEAGSYSLAFDDVSNGQSYGALEGILMRFRLKGGGGAGYGIGGGGEGGELTVVDVINENRFPLTLTVGGAGQPSIVTASTADPVPMMTPISCGAPVLIAINAGGDFIEPNWQLDANYIEGAANVAVPSASVNVSGVTNPAPADVYRSIRYTPTPTQYPFFSAVIPVTADRSYRVRLHFFDAWSMVPTQRLFHISINGQRVETDFDIIGRAGGQYRALAPEYLVDVGDDGQIVILFENHVSDAMVSGIEILPVLWGDRWYEGGYAAPTTAIIDVSQVTRPAPMEVYQTCRSGGNTIPPVSYTIPSDVAIPGSVYHLRLHFCENWVPTRIMSVLVNGHIVADNLSIMEHAGGQYIAYILEVDVTATSAGLVIALQNSIGQNAIISGIELEEVAVLMQIEQGHDADANSPGAGGEYAIIPETEDRSPLTALVIPGASGRFAWPGYRSADGGGTGGLSGLPENYTELPEGATDAGIYGGGGNSWRGGSGQRPGDGYIMINW